ncbi:leishmanolysin [Mytilus galloprovincialis]|uniref:Leishmanolysin n=1 Tax=Mytilus galloprovincialis TaxID=29158 RepID=A0A8B6BY78_MYTGA|nr:leishmanolysin [Mytilus galloprovincialis]
MILLWIFVVNLVRCNAVEENYPCAFIPNDSMKCLEYWTLKEMNHNCTDVKDDLMFTGLIKKVDGEQLISVRASSESLGQASCEFTPNASKPCLDFWTLTDMTYGCLNVQSSMTFSGLRKTVEGETCISVNATDINTGNMVTVWVRKADGHCTMDCCEDPCHDVTCQNGGNCSSGLCACVNGYTGQHCEINDPCHDVTCQNGGLCLSGLCGCVNGFIGRRCEMMIPATTVKIIQTTQTSGQQTISSGQSVQSTLTGNQQTIPALKQCVDEQFVNCQDPDICQSPFSDRCPLSCKLCVPITTQKPCADSKFVNCEDHMVCSSPVSQYCPVSCGTCSSKSTMHVTTAKPSTTTGWLSITRRSGIVVYIGSAFVASFYDTKGKFRNLHDDLNKLRVKFAAKKGCFHTAKPGIILPKDSGWQEGENVKEKRFLLGGDLACIAQVCLHGGHCEAGNCVCEPPYYGPHCGKYGPCHNKVCHNGGFCVYGLCVFGKSTDDTCAGITCKNGGSCNDGHCSCTTGFSGDQCQNYDPCHNVSCMKGGYCVKGVCYCPNNNQRLPCEHCLPNQCSGHGKCINLRTGFSCTCDTGYTGITCNTDCHPDPCNRNGHCTNSPSGFSCFCQNGYTGSTCNKDCLPDPCKGHGSCYDGKQGYFCNCHAGFTGQNCDRSKLNCSPDPCNGNGICHNTQTGFTCSCHQGYTGQTCAAHCSPDPCNGRGACYNGKTDYYCQCQIGYTGRNCQTVSTTPAATTHISGLGSMPMLPSGLQQTINEHHCNKLGLLMDLAVGKALHQQGAKGCGGNSADAVLIKHCQAPSFSRWRRGLQVINHCNQLNPYTPVGEWDSARFTNNIGVMTSCQSGVIEMISQSCGSQLNLRNITSPAFNSVYTIDWT